MSGRFDQPPLIPLPAGASRWLDARIYWPDNQTWGGAPPATIQGVARGGAQLMGSYIFTGGCTTAVRNNLPAIKLLAANGASLAGGRPVSVPPLAPAAPSSFDTPGRRVWRWITRFAWGAASTPTADVGLRVVLHGGVGSAPAGGGYPWMTDASDGDGRSGFGILMLNNAPTFVARRQKDAIGVFAIRVPLAWPGALTDWCDVEFRVTAAGAGEPARVRVLLNGVSHGDYSFGDGLLPYPGSAFTETAAAIWAPQVRTHASGSDLYVAEWADIRVPDGLDI